MTRTLWASKGAIVVLAATVGLAAGQSLSLRLDDELTEPRLYGRPDAAPADWLAPPGPQANPLGFLLRPWASPNAVCELAAGSLTLAEQFESPDGVEVFCYWLLAPSLEVTIFFQANGSRTDTRTVRYKLASTPETFPDDAATLAALVRDFHVQRGWMVPQALPDPASVDDESFEARGVQYRVWRESGDTPRINLTMVFPEVGLSSSGF
jgi:hypothetical protein